LGVLVVLASLRVIRPDLRNQGRRQFDATGALLVTGGLVALTYGILRSDRLGLGSPGVLLPIAAAVVLVAGFVFVEARVAEQPLLPLSILRSRQLRAANLVVLLLFSATFSTFFFFTLYLQKVLGDNAIQAGLSFLPLTLLVFASSTLAPWLVGRFGVRPVITAGMLFVAAGQLLLTGVRPGLSFLFPTLPASVLIGLGIGSTLVPATVAATTGVPASQSGLASGLLSTSRLIGGALGLAVLSTIASSHEHVRPGVTATHALTNGLTVAFSVAVGLALAGAAVAALLLRPHRAAPSHESVPEVGPEADVAARSPEPEALAA
jgi:Na+/melibiose symporter-like transporter